MDIFEENRNWWHEFIIQVFKEWIIDHTPDSEFRFKIGKERLTANEILEQMQNKKEEGMLLISHIKMKLIDPSFGFANTPTEEAGKLLAGNVVANIMRKIECLSAFN